MTTELLDAPATPKESVLLENGHRYEWVDGQWVQKPMGAESGLIALRIMIRVGAHVEAHQLGFAFRSDPGYQIFADDPRRTQFSDGSFIRRGRFPEEKVPKGHLQIAPDWLLEVVSPNDLAYEVEKKVADYLQAGVRLLWVVYPNTHGIMVYRHRGAFARLTEADELNGEEVLPGFTCRVDDLFVGI